MNKKEIFDKCCRECGCWRDISLYTKNDVICDKCFTCECGEEKEHDVKWCKKCQHEEEVMSMEPTVGRVVYFNQGAHVLAAIIAYVWSPTCVNLMVINQNGESFPKTSIIQGSQINEWDWMPYQKAKAAAGNHNSESAEPKPA